MQIIHLDYEVFGKVQGVFLRKHTKKKADTIGLRGWVQNTTDETVKGEIQGSVEAVEKMKIWLKKEGSPKSRIDKTVFGEARTIESSTLFLISPL